MTPRIVIVSEDLVEPWDEGIKKFAASIGNALAVDHPVRMINVDRSGFTPPVPVARAGQAATTIQTVPGTRTFLQRPLHRAVVSFRPDVVVYVPSSSSTVSSFARAFVLKRYRPGARVGMVALIPRRHPRALEPVLRAAAPDRVFVPSYASLLHLADLSVRGRTLPVGVDLATFRPASAAERRALRHEFGLLEDAFVYLHVGHLRPKRNLGPLARLARQPGARVIVVGSTSTPEDARVRSELEAAGAIVIREVVPVHKLYRLADCYVFPTIDGEGCVEMPLSVVEALASGLPVLARSFGGLRDFVAAGEDVRYFDTDDELVAHAEALRRGGRPPVRDMREFAWRAVAERIVGALLDPDQAAA